MKILILLLVLCSLASARELVADLASVLAEPPIRAKTSLGEPITKSATSASWKKKPWSWHLNFEKGRTVHACVEFIPDGVTYSDMQDLASAFGFTASKGWTIGPAQKTTPVIDSFFLTHKERGIFLLKAARGEKEGTWSILNFFAPGYSSPPPARTP